MDAEHHAIPTDPGPLKLYRFTVSMKSGGKFIHITASSPQWAAFALGVQIAGGGEPDCRDPAFRALDPNPVEIPYDPALTEVCVSRPFPGAWVDGNGVVHFSLPEMLAHCGIPDLPEEREENIRLFQLAMRQTLGPGTQFITRTEPGPPPPLS